MAEYNHNLHIKGSKKSLVNPEIHHISILDLTVQSNAATIVLGVYHLQFGLEFSESNANIPPPKPLHLTSNGEGKQLTVEKPTGQLDQEIN